MGLVGVGKIVFPHECVSIPVESLRQGQRIVEDNRIVAQIVERESTIFCACRNNVHVRTHDGKRWCYTGGTKVTVTAF